MDENNQIIIYQSEHGDTHIEVKFTGEPFGFRNSSFANYMIQARPMLASISSISLMKANLMIIQLFRKF